ncbi:MAG: hypothetical protein U0169_01445 [Polyangiaceae bacterium]
MAFAAFAPLGCSRGSEGGDFTPVDAGVDAEPQGPSFGSTDATAPLTDADPQFNDASIVTDGAGCTLDAGAPGPIKRRCLAPTENECDGQHDFPGFTNGMQGNGFDDDCDGMVDEGCACPATGATKECYLVPPSQTVASTGKPAGWCAENSRGTMECGGGEFRRWSGLCRGAQPAYADDVCSPGDFDCDGAELNSRTNDCSCKEDVVRCPTSPLRTVPYPSPSALPLKVDAASWMINAGLAAQATGYKWTLRGGDCDNILPHPTFGLFATASATSSPIGTTVTNLGTSGLEKGTVVKNSTVKNVVYPAFSLSGDYFLEAEFDLLGQHYSCLQKIEVRAPGLRVEACWDTEPAGVDLDLHVARVDFPPAGNTSCPKKGWGSTCADQDCYYANCKSSDTTGPDWSYAPSPNADACVGWGSTATGACRNPRLDRDANGGINKCRPSVSDPNATGTDGFCAPENVNVDTPAVNSTYAVGLKYFAGGSGGDSPSKAHVNVYCNGERVISSGYNPVTGSDFPVLRQSGGDSSGDMWKVAMVRVTGATADGITCEVAPVPSRSAHATTDGSTAYCVDNSATDTGDSVTLLTPGGYRPLDAAAMCFH